MTNEQKPRRFRLNAHRIAPLPAALGVLAGGAAHAAVGVDDTFTAVGINSTQLVGNVLANDGGTPPLTIVGGAGNHDLSYGSANVAAAGNVIYRPLGCVSAPVTDDPFLYVVRDSSVPADSGNVNVTINLVPPTVPDAYVTQANTAVSGNVLDNDLPAGNAMPVFNFTPAAHGTAALDASATPSNGQLVYTPDPGFSGVDSFSYSVRTGFSNCLSTAAVSVTVQPIAVADAFNTPYATQVSGNVLGNDIGSGLDVVSNTPPAHGTANVNADGSFVYTPASGFAGTDSFQYTIEDDSGDAQTSTAAVTINVAAAPPPPAPPAAPAPVAGRGVLAALAALLVWLGLRRRRED